MGVHFRISEVPLYDRIHNRRKRRFRETVHPPKSGISYPFQSNLAGTFPRYRGKQGTDGFEAEFREESLYTRVMTNAPPQVLGRFLPQSYTRIRSQKDASGVGPN